MGEVQLGSTYNPSKDPADGKLGTELRQQEKLLTKPFTTIFRRQEEDQNIESNRQQEAFIKDLQTTKRSKLCSSLE